MYNKLIRVNNPAQQEDRQQLIKVILYITALLILNGEVPGDVVIGTGDQEEYLKQEGSVLVNSGVFLLFLLLEPLDARLCLKQGRYHG